MLALLAPGQGAQKPGMLSAWLKINGARELLGDFSSECGLDLERYATVGTADQLRDTAVTQPLLTAAALLSADLLGDLDGVDVVAGHSVGELAAASIAGVFNRMDAVRLARIRGIAMADAARHVKTGMSAVVGGPLDTILERIQESGATAANINGARQVVAAGTLEQLATLADDPKLGAQVIALPVAGAFHTQYMKPAASCLKSALGGVEVRDPNRALLSNTDGAVVTGAAEAVRRLVWQVSRPVRWDLCVQTMRTLRVTAIIELCPGGTLTGLVKRELPGVQLLPLRTPDDLPAARAVIAEHAGFDGHHRRAGVARDVARVRPGRRP